MRQGSNAGASQTADDAAGFPGNDEASGAVRVANGATVSDPVDVRGAGPAGLAAAIAVARAGCRVIVRERRADVGGRFHGDFQGLENWSRPGDVLEELSERGISGFDAHAVRRAVCFGPDGRPYEARSPAPIFYLVRRGSGPGTLDGALKRAALELGVDLRFRDASPPPGRGIVAHGPARGDTIAVGYTFTTEMDDGAYVALSNRLAPSGYGYLLIAGGLGTLAACLFSAFDRRDEALERTGAFFEREVGMRMRDPLRFGGVGSCLAPPRRSTPDLSFVGEAAGFQDALWGFGIRYALESGDLAGRCWARGEPEAFDRAWRRTIGGALRRGLVNRLAFAALGNLGYAALARWVARADDAREWLRRRYARAGWADLVYPLARARYG